MDTLEVEFELVDVPVISFINTFESALERTISETDAAIIHNSLMNLRDNIMRNCSAITENNFSVDQFKEYYTIVYINQNLELFRDSMVMLYIHPTPIPILSLVSRSRPVPPQNHSGRFSRTTSE